MKIFLVLLVFVAVVSCDCACDFKGCGPQADCTDSCCKCNGIGICDPSGCCDGSCIRSVDCCYGCTCTNSQCGGSPGFLRNVHNDIMMMKMAPPYPGLEHPSPPRLPDRWSATVLTDVNNIYQIAFDYPKKMSSVRIDHAGREEIISCYHSKNSEGSGICYMSFDDKCKKQPERHIIPQEPLQDARYRGIVWFHGKRLHHWEGFWKVPVNNKVDYYSYEKDGVHIPYFVVIDDVTHLEFKDFSVDDVKIKIPKQCA